MSIFTKDESKYTGNPYWLARDEVNLMKQWMKRGIKNVKGYYIRPRKIALTYALAAFICLLVLWLYVGNLAKERFSLEEHAQVTNRVNTIGTSLSLAVNQRLALITSIRSFIETEIDEDYRFSFNNPEENEHVNSYMVGLYENTAGIRNIAIAPDGVMKYVYPYEENKSVLGYEPARDDRPYVREEVQRAIQSGGIVLSLPYDLIQGGQGLIARQAINVDGRFWGLANVVLDVPPLLEEAGIIPMPTGLELALKDQSGRVFVGSEDVFAVDPVIYDVELPEGSWYLAAAPATGWGMNYRSFMRLYNGLGLIATVAISIVVYLFTHRRERLTDLVDRRTQELIQSNQTLISVLEGIDADVYVADFASYEILFANKHLRESFKDNLIGKICYQVFRHEATVCTHCKNNFLLDMDGQPTGVLVWEDFNPITERWYRNADRAIRWHDGCYVHLQIATDISEQKKDKAKLEGLLQEKEILLAEVHHRVKNNMQVIISLLGLQANEIEDEVLRGVYEESRNRIKSMTLVHEQLYRSNEYARIEFGPYIDQLATTLFNAYQVKPDQIRLSITAEDIYIDLERAIPCGLLLNELITNSLKYAFPDNRKGHIWIELKPEGNHMRLIFGDDGIGLPDDLNFEETQSLGLQLVRLLTVHDLHGDIELRYGYEKGARFLIKFPISGMKSESINQEKGVAF